MRESLPLMSIQASFRVETVGCIDRLLPSNNRNSLKIPEGWRFLLQDLVEYLNTTPAQVVPRQKPFGTLDRKIRWLLFCMSRKSHHDRPSGQHRRTSWILSQEEVT